MKTLKTLFAFSIGLSILMRLTSCENDHQNSDSVYVDYLTDNYLLIEMDVWKDIASNRDVKEVINKIQNVHLNLFSDPFLISEPPTDDIFLNGKNFIDQQRAEVNLYVRTVTENYLRSPIDVDGRKKEILEMATHNSNTTLMDTMYEAVTKEDFFGYVNTMAEEQKCVKHGQTIDSVNYRLFQYYNDVAKSQLEAYALVQLSNMLLAAYGEKNYVEKAKDVRIAFNERNKKTQEYVRKLMRTARRDVWKCDLSPQTYDDHKFQVTHFLEGFVDNEVNLNANNDCTQSCSDYTVTKNYGCHEGTLCEKEPQNLKTRCNGTIINCDFIESDMVVCFTENYSKRRYTNIVLGSGKKLGTDNCYHSPTTISSWTRWFVQCSNCFCLCDEMSEETERYFSLKEAVSDTSSNEIVTGVGIFKEKGLFTWSIQTSRLSGNGQVNLTKTWNAFTEIEKFQPNGRVDGVDYHTLSHQNRSVNLDTVIAPVGTVVTGVRFKVIGGALNVEIRATRFEFSTGMLFNDHKWISNENENIRRTEISLKQSNLPSKASEFSVPNDEFETFVKFQPSDIEKDVAQTTIPFIDSQIVESFDRQAPLSGIGIHFKGSSGYGGFIAPKVITYDMTSHIGSRGV